MKPDGVGCFVVEGLKALLCGNALRHRYRRRHLFQERHRHWRTGLHCSLQMRWQPLLLRRSWAPMNHWIRHRRWKFLLDVATISPV